MTQKARLKDVAAKAGVAVNTASTILNRRPNSWASKETEERVFAAAESLGYRPNQTARALQSGRYHAIGLLIPDLLNPFFSTLADELEAAVEARGYRLVIGNSRGNVSRERQLFDTLEDQEVDGAVTYLSDNEAFHEQLENRFRSGKPIVSLANGIPHRTSPVDTVISDSTEGLAQAVETLCQLGHRRFAFLSALSEGQADGSRPVLFRKLLLERGIPAAHIRILRCHHTLESSCQAVASCFQQPRAQRPTALFTVNDHSAIGAMRAAMDAGLHIPRDLSVVGFDDIPLAAYLPLTLSTIRQFYRETAETAVEMLLSRMGEPRQPRITPRQVVFPTRFLLRESCGPVRRPRKAD